MREGIAFVDSTRGGVSGGGMVQVIKAIRSRDHHSNNHLETRSVVKKCNVNTSSKFT